MHALEYLFGLEFHGHKFGLDNIRALTADLGAPERAYPTLHIAGTNGKGSVAAYCSTALRAAGHRTGCFTSPHIVRVEERFAIDGEAVSRGELENAIDDVRRSAEALMAAGTLPALPTFFEVAATAAFLLFRAHRVDVAVLEAGLGGRLDATNVAAPLVGVITNIDLDHQQYLGTTIAAIAGEKAGIIKPGMAIVSGERKPEARNVIAAACRDRGATLIEAAEATVAEASFVDGRIRMALTTPVRAYPACAVGLRGRHQIDNAIVAVRALEALDAAGVPVPADAIVSGLEGARWPGRLQLVELPGGRRALLDAAHNPAGARTLGAYLGECHPDGVTLVFAAMHDKDIPAILRELLPHAAHVVLTKPPTFRAAALDELQAAVAAVRPDCPVTLEAEPARAVDRALALTPQGGTLCVAGSVYLLGAVVPVIADLASRP